VITYKQNKHRISTDDSELSDEMQTPMQMQTLHPNKTQSENLSSQAKKRKKKKKKTLP